MALGKNMKHALMFARKYPGWHEYAEDRATVVAIRKLAELGYVELNEYHQYRVREEQP